MRRTYIALIVLATAVTSVASEERRPLKYEEPWSRTCAQLAQNSPRIGGDIKVPIAIRRTEPVHDQKKWKLRCEDIHPIFELIVDETGKVLCARIIQFTKGRPPDGLYDEVRASLLKMIYKPATKHGKPIRVIMNLTIMFKCA